MIQKWTLRGWRWNRKFPVKAEEVNNYSKGMSRGRTGRNVLTTDLIMDP